QEDAGGDRVRAAQQVEHADAAVADHLAGVRVRAEEVKGAVTQRAVDGQCAEDARVDNDQRMRRARQHGERGRNGERRGGPPWCGYHRSPPPAWQLGPELNEGYAAPLRTQ